MLSGSTVFMLVVSQEKLIIYRVWNKYFGKFIYLKFLIFSAEGIIKSPLLNVNIVFEISGWFNYRSREDCCSGYS
jgi:hypothetical protein